MFAFLVPAIMWIGHEVFGALEPTAASIIAAQIGRLSSTSGLAGDVVRIFESQLGTLADEKKQEFQLKLNSLLGQIQLDAIDEQSESLFKSGYRPFIAWGLGINIVLHSTIVTIINILHLFHVEVNMIAPIDTVTLTLISGILGLYMVLRTGEKYKGVN